MVHVLDDAQAQSLAVDLREDLDTRWVPDVLADADLVGQLQRPRLDQDDVAMIQVPKPSHGSRAVPMLSGSAMSFMRQAIRPVRSIAEAVLQPTVCGYRNGASGDVSYSDEYRRFREMSAALADDHLYISTADITNFFDSVDHSRVRTALVGTLGDIWQSVDHFLEKIASLGVKGLPAGYGDSRMLANLILAEADKGIGVPFVRWVDDYRIFTNSPSEADAAIRRLAISLAPLGLHLNQSKSKTMTTREFLHRHLGKSLDSVYHPQDEPGPSVQANLRSVFLAAMAESDRRRLRFVLPRMAAQRDNFAVTFSLDALRQATVDAPRIVAYLANFLDDERVCGSISDIMLHEIAEEDWTLSRLTPLLVRVPLSSSVIDRAFNKVMSTDSPIVWGLMLRVLSAHRRTDLTLDALSSQILDPRAAVAACFDIDIPVPDVLEHRAGPTVQSLAKIGAAPLPRVQSLL